MMKDTTKRPRNQQKERKNGEWGKKHIRESAYQGVDIRKPGEQAGMAGT
jgi:hypothetical protein